MFPFNHKFSKDDLESLEKELVKLEAELELPELTDDVRSKVYYYLSLAQEAQLSTVMKKPVAEVKKLDQKPTSPMDQQKDNSPKDQEALDKAAKREAKKQRFARINQALTWLCDTYPNCFNAKDPKPLKIRIWQDILGNMKRESSSDQPSSMSVRQALHHYTCNLLYHQAMLNNSHRIDLEGQTADEITDQARTHAQGWIEVKELAKQKWQEKQKERKKEQKKPDLDPVPSEESSDI